MEVIAKLSNYRQSPRKVRLLADLVNGMDIKPALGQLKYNSQKASNVLAKLIASAVANATNNFQLQPDNLFIKQVTVDDGPTLKRWRARAFGRAATIRKRSCHIRVILDEKEPTTPPAGKQPGALNQPATADKPAEKIKMVNKLADLKTEFKKSDIAGEESPDDQKEQITKPAEWKKNKKGFVPKIFQRKSG